MKKVIFLIGIACALLTFTNCSSYNKMTELDEATQGAWAQVENQYQRRADLVPNLVNTVKGYAAHEKSTFEAVIEARAKATSVNISAEDLTEENLEKFQKAQDALSSSLGRLLATAEAYPELKSNEQFRDLMAQLEGTENRIATERRNFNESVQTYNSYIRRFPKNIIASIFDFDKRGYFKADAGVENAPKVRLE